MPIDYLKYYTPKNLLSVTWTENREVHTSGQINTTYPDGVRGYVQGQISSEAHILSYAIKITYDGPVNIGDRQLKLQNIPNYWTDQQVEDEVYRATAINPSGEPPCPATSFPTAPYSSAEWNLALLCSIFCLACLCVAPFANEDTEKRKQTYLAELDKIASDRMSRDIANLVEAADRSVSARVSYSEGQNNPNLAPQGQVQVQAPAQGQGLITLTNEQLQMLLAQARPQAPIDLGNNNMNNQNVNAIPIEQNKAAELRDRLL